VMVKLVRNGNGQGLCDGIGNSHNLQQRLSEWKPREIKGVLRLVRLLMEIGSPLICMCWWEYNLRRRGRDGYDSLQVCWT